MSGGRNSGRGGRGWGGRGGRSRGWCHNYTGSANTARKGICANPGTNVFDYGQKSAADQMRTSSEKLAQYVGTNYGQDISNKLQNKITVILVEPVHTDDVILKHSLRETMIHNGQMNIQRDRKAQETILDAAVLAGLDMEAPMKLALLQNEISQGELSAIRKATMPGYNKDAWLSTKANTNIIALSNLIQKYRVTYDSDDKMFVVHRESQGKPNMEFRMHECGLHYYDPRNEKHLAFVNTVSENKEGFTKRQIKNSELARNLYKTLSYPSMKDFKWAIQSNQIKDCPMTVQYIDVAQKIWDTNIAALKGKTTQSKSIPAARDYVKVPMELMKLHTEVFLTTDIFFVNKIPFFLTLSRKICFTAVNHLTDRIVCIYSRLLKRCIRIISSVVSTSRRCTPMANLRLSSPWLSLCQVAPWSIWQVPMSTYPRSNG
jgi:hypothetical protein